MRHSKILNLLANLDLLLRGNYLDEVNFIFLSGVIWRAFSCSYTTSFIDLRMVVNKYYEFTILNQAWFDMPNTNWSRLLRKLNKYLLPSSAQNSCILTSKSKVSCYYDWCCFFNWRLVFFERNSLIEDIYLKATSVKAIDTTGAGDAFNGGLAYALSQNKSIKDSLNLANQIAGLSTLKLGAGDAMPLLSDLGWI